MWYTLLIPVIIILIPRLFPKKKEETIVNTEYEKEYYKALQIFDKWGDDIETLNNITYDCDEETLHDLVLAHDDIEIEQLLLEMEVFTMLLRTGRVLMERATRYFERITSFLSSYHRENSIYECVIGEYSKFDMYLWMIYYTKHLQRLDKYTRKMYNIIEHKSKYYNSIGKIIEIIFHMEHNTGLYTQDFAKLTEVPFSFAKDVLLYLINKYDIGNYRRRLEEMFIKRNDSQRLKIFMMNWNKLED